MLEGTIKKKLDYSGFDIKITYPEFNTKLAEIVASLSRIQLIYIANLPHLNIQGFEVEITGQLLQTLTNLDFFHKSMATHTYSEYEVEDEKSDDKNSNTAKFSSFVQEHVFGVTLSIFWYAPYRTPITITDF